MNYFYLSINFYNYFAGRRAGHLPPGIQVLRFTVRAGISCACARIYYAACINFFFQFLRHNLISLS